MTKVNRIINKHNWKGKKVSSGNDDWKKFEKNNAKIALNSFKLKKRNISPKMLMFQKITQIMKNKLFF